MTITVSGAPDDPLGALVYGWIANQRSVHTRNAYRLDITGWLEFCAERGLWPLAAGRTDVALWARRLQASGCAASTAARKLSSVSSWYAWLLDGGHVTENPAASVKRPVVDRRHSMTPGLTREQANAMLRAAARSGPQGLRNAAMLALMLHTGVRVSEAIGADVEDLGADQGHRVLWVTRKGGERAALVLNATVTRQLDAYLASRDDVVNVPALPGEPDAPKPRRVLFVTENGKRLYQKNIWRIVRAVATSAGLPADLISRLCAHAMRHTAITFALAVAPLQDVQDMAGHKSPETTQRYNRARHRLERSPAYAIGAYLAQGED
jgi:integrase/recombinase XerD